MQNFSILILMMTFIKMQLLQGQFAGFPDKASAFCMRGTCYKFSGSFANSIASCKIENSRTIVVMPTDRCASIVRNINTYHSNYGRINCSVCIGSSFADELNHRCLKNENEKGGNLTLSVSDMYGDDFHLHAVRLDEANITTFSSDACLEYVVALCEMRTDELVMYIYLGTINCQRLEIERENDKVCGNLREGKMFRFTTMQHLYCPLTLEMGNVVTNVLLNAKSTWLQLWYIKKVRNKSKQYILMNAMDDSLTYYAENNSITTDYPKCHEGQLFTFEPASNGACFIHVNSKSSNMVLSTLMQLEKCHYAKVMIEEKDYSADQLWYFEEVDTTTKQIARYPDCSCTVPEEGKVYKIFSILDRQPLTVGYPKRNLLHSFIANLFSNVHPDYIQLWYIKKMPSPLLTYNIMSFPDSLALNADGNTVGQETTDDNHCSQFTFEPNHDCHLCETYINVGSVKNDMVLQKSIFQPDLFPYGHFTVGHKNGSVFQLWEFVDVNEEFGLNVQSEILSLFHNENLKMIVFLGSLTISYLFCAFFLYLFIFKRNRFELVSSDILQNCFLWCINFILYQRFKVQLSNWIESRNSGRS